jgi:hypothetical protein
MKQSWVQLNTNELKGTKREGWSKHIPNLGHDLYVRQNEAEKMIKHLNKEVKCVRDLKIISPYIWSNDINTILYYTNDKYNEEAPPIRILTKTKLASCCG